MQPVSGATVRIFVPKSCASDERECIGIEPSRIPIGSVQVEKEAAQKSAQTPDDADLETLIRAWSHLPKSIKAAIRALIGSNVSPT
jgi:hypothetical protein